ncbi:ABC transporter substrate-binding protein, partial [Rhizobium ruizarguesonis]
MTFSAILLCGVAAFSAFAAPAFSQDWTKATITLEGAYAPWNITTADGTLGGFEPELATVLCER